MVLTLCVEVDRRFWVLWRSELWFGFMVLTDVIVMIEGTIPKKTMAILKFQGECQCEELDFLSQDSMDSLGKV